MPALTAKVAEKMIPFLGEKISPALVEKVTDEVTPLLVERVAKELKVELIPPAYQFLSHHNKLWEWSNIVTLSYGSGLIFVSMDEWMGRLDGCMHVFRYVCSYVCTYRYVLQLQLLYE